MEYDVTNFDEQVIERSKELPILVDFWAAWCGPCRALGPVLEQLAEEETAWAEPRWRLAKVDTEALPEIADRYGIRSIPNVKLFIDGTVVDEFSGALPEAMVRSWLQKVLPGKHEEQIELVRRLMEEDRLLEARKLLEEILTDEPENDAAGIMLGNAWLRDDPQKAEEAVHKIHEDSPLFDQAEAVRVMAFLARAALNPDSLPEGTVRENYLMAARATVEGDFDTALERLIDVIREDRYYADDSSRRACIAIFKTLGEGHPITRKHRRSFDGALYV